MTDAFRELTAAVGNIAVYRLPAEAPLSLLPDAGLRE